MANKSARDKCFEEATDAYNDSVPDNEKIKIDHQKPWGIGDDGKWRPFGLLDRLWDWIRDSDAVYRVPDWTVEIDGKPVAGDNKFSGDRFQNRPGRSGNNQQTDQNQMNEDQNPGKQEYQDLNLNPEKCKCDDNPKPQEVYVRVPSPFMVPGTTPAPGTVPGGATAPEAVPEVPEIPEFPGIPEFVFP